MEAREECFSKLLLLYTVYGQRHGRTSRLQTATITPHSVGTPLECVCVCKYVCEAERSKKKHACISTRLSMHAWLHSMQSCIARPHLVTHREVWGKSYQAFRIAITLKILRQPFFFWQRVSKHQNLETALLVYLLVGYKHYLVSLVWGVMASHSTCKGCLSTLFKVICELKFAKTLCEPDETEDWLPKIT